jgi:hypothetical protein
MIAQEAISTNKKKIKKDQSNIILKYENAGNYLPFSSGSGDVISGDANAFYGTIFTY